MVKPGYIIRLIIAAVLLLLAIAPAMAQTNTVCAGQTSTLSVVEVPGDTYTWELYNDVTGINFAVKDGNILPEEAFFVGGDNQGPSVDVTWLKPGTYFFKVTAVREGCTDNLKVGMMIVLEKPVAELSLNPTEVCVGNAATLTVAFTGTGPWNFVLEADDGINKSITTYENLNDNPYSFDVNPVVKTTYRVISVTNANCPNADPSNSVTLIVNPLPRPSPIYHE